MRPNSGQRQRLSLAAKLSRLAGRLRDKEWRRYGGLLIAGKAIGLVAVLAVIYLVSNFCFAHVYAAEGPP